MIRHVALLGLWLLLSAFTHVQGNINNDGSGGGDATIAVTLGATVTSGNMVPCTVGWVGTATGDLTAVDDDQANSYTIADRLRDAASGWVTATAYRLNVTNAPQTMTAHLSPSGTFASIVCDEYSGVATSAALDQHTIVQNNAIGTGTDAVTTGNVTTGVNGELIYGSAIDSTNGSVTTMSSGTGYTARESISGEVDEDKTQSTAGAVAATFTTNVSGNNVHATIMTFKPPAGASSARMRSLMGVGQ